MKKTMVMLAAVAVAGMAMADLSVEYKLGAPISTAGHTGSPYMASGSLCQLIWRADNVGYQAADITDAISLTRAGDVLLLSSACGNAGTRSSLGSTVYTDADVGQAVNTGYFFARIFDSAAPVVGSYFIDVGIQGPALKAYSATDPLSAYVGNIAGTANVAIDAFGTQVIPEPATFGMMAIAGLGLFLARKKTRS
jgi:hypothetical protein